jgi:hypothetical protein
MTLHHWRNYSRSIEVMHGAILGSSRTLPVLLETGDFCARAAQINRQQVYMEIMEHCDNQRPRTRMSSPMAIPQKGVVAGFWYTRLSPGMQVFFAKNRCPFSFPVYYCCTGMDGGARVCQLNIHVRADCLDEDRIHFGSTHPTASALRSKIGSAVLALLWSRFACSAT